MTNNTRDEFAKLAHSVKYRIEQQKTPNEEGANKALQILIDTHHQELQKAREQTIRDMERKMMGWSGTATAMLKDYRRIIYRVQSELDQPDALTTLTQKT